MDNSVAKRFVGLICESCPLLELFDWLKLFDGQPPSTSVDGRASVSAQCMNVAGISMYVK